MKLISITLSVALACLQLASIVASEGANVVGLSPNASESYDGLSWGADMFRSFNGGDLDEDDEVAHDGEWLDEDSHDARFLLDDEAVFMNDTEYDEHLRRQLACSGCVVNYNRRVMTGTHKMIAVPVEFSNCRFGGGNKAVPRGALRSAMSYLSSFYRSKSLGKVRLTGSTIDSVKRLNTNARCSAKFTVKRTYSYSGYDIKIATYPCSICGFANAGGGWIHLGKSSFGTSTVAHEAGHLFGLGHAGSFSYKNGKIVGISEYGDYTSQMGKFFANSYNAAMHHWLGWLRPHEAVYVKPGKTYKLRALGNVGINKGDVRAALVYDLPHSGNRLYISLRRRQDGIGKRQFFKTNPVGFAVNIANPCRNCRFLKTILVKVFKNRYEDETGLVIEGSFPATGKTDIADVKISYNKAKDLCTKKPTFTLVGSLNKKRQTIVTITLVNNNPASCRPLYIGGDLITGIKGSSANYQTESKKKGPAYNNRITINGGTKQIRLYRIIREKQRGEFVFSFAGTTQTYCIEKDSVAVKAC